MEENYRITVMGDVAQKLLDDPTFRTEFINNLPPIRRSITVPAVVASALTQISDKTGLPTGTILTALVCEGIQNALDTNRTEFPRWVQDRRTIVKAVA